MDFLSVEFSVTRLALACRVPAGTGDRVHQDRPTHGLAMNVSGEKRYAFRGGATLTVGEGDIIFLPEGSTYTVEDVLPGDCLAINFCIAEPFAFSPAVLHPQFAAELNAAFSRAERAFTAGREGFLMQCRAELYAIIAILLREREAVGTGDGICRLLAPALTCIHETYDKTTPSLPALASLCRISRAYFCRLFRVAYGTSPVQYILDLRLARAKQLLAQDVGSLETVAALSGFGDVSYFCRYFKKTVGCTPSEYKKQAHK